MLNHGTAGTTISRTTEGWPYKFPVGRTIVALSIVPPLSLLIPILTGILIQRPPGALENLNDRHFPLFILILSWPGYVVFAGLGIPILLLFFRFKLARFWEFAIAGMICTEIPWLIVAFTGPRDAATVHAQLRSTLPPFAVMGIVNGIITRLIVLGVRRPI